MSNGGGGNPLGAGDENPRGGGGENTMGTSGGNPRGYGGRGPRGCSGESPRGYSNSKPTGTVEGWVAARLGKWVACGGDDGGGFAKCLLDAVSNTVETSSTRDHLLEEGKNFVLNTQDGYDDDQFSSD
ncbi:hypothetical protein OsJ_17605 [Oryza sativa Japonica Group]|uniref:Uncharacterized protein n=1 Tax=Oryza sativa subsp. japonica TaxID=39947 RepID=B9FN65_ORYSJ|nr:hypothetical protein OsJ_17605 [Oryza sativa Japonica Group]